jgi:hypothetical protein
MSATTTGHMSDIGDDDDVSHVCDEEISDVRCHGLPVMASDDRLERTITTTAAAPCRPGRPR